MPLIPGQRLGSYEVVSALGAGGMGEVYRARDSRLGRDVALKVLPPDVVNEPGRLERFDREARAIAALNHPHIVTIHSTEEADGIRFLTMELVDGCTLGELVTPGGMPMAKFLEVAAPLADALAAAHQKQITHRDLKPGNVMLSKDGRLKVLDFGLARVGGADAGEQTLLATQAPITHHGMIVGTMPYMSPEQVEGRPLDPRSDLFSLGVIFYELLSGDRPFKGSSSPALMSAILRDTPSSVFDARPEIPEALDRLISRLLEKRPEDRVQTARDVYNELRHIKSESSTGVQRKFTDRSAVESLSVAVLPFTFRGDPDAEALASALTDDIAASLAKFPGLSVVASQSTRGFKDSTIDLRQVAERLRARYVITGNVRKAGSAIRTTAQAIDAISGEQLWTENFDRRLDEADLFTIQDDLTDHIVATVGDKYGVLAKSIVKSLDRHAIYQSSPTQLLMHGWGFQHRPLAEVHAELRQALESRLAADPHDAHLWAELANMCVVEHSLSFNPLPDPIGRAMAAARRAIELDRGNQNGWLWLAIAHFHEHDRAGFDEAAERAIRINPRNAYALAWMGNILTHIGEYERGCALTERAMQINPGHPGWLHFAVFNRHFAAGNYELALQAARRVNMREFFWMHFAIAAACGHLGRNAEGRTAAQEMVRLNPQIADDAGLREFVTRWYWPDEMVEALIEGVRRSFDEDSAGVRRSFDGGSAEVRRSPKLPSNERPSSDSGADATFVINVTPLKASAGDAAASLADGLTQGIAVALSRFPYLRVIARDAVDARVTTGYSLQGSVRAAGDVMRVVMQLTDAATGTSIWGQTYDRDLRSAPLFEMQDALIESIVATLADTSGALVRAIAAVVRAKPIEMLTPYEAVMRRFAYIHVMSAADHAVVRDALERAVKVAPSYATAWAQLAGIYVEEFAQSYNPKPDPLGRARAAAHRALELDPMHASAHAALALVHFFERDFEGFRSARDQALLINPLDTVVLSYLGALTAYSGDWEAGLAMGRRAMALNPQHPGIYWMPAILDLYRRRDYRAALELFSRVNLPKYPNSLIARAAIYGQLGRFEEGRAMLREAEALAPGISSSDSATRRKWLPPDLEEHIQQGLDRLSPAAVPSSSDSSAQMPRATDASIAVLPFTDLSEKKDQDWFCDGIAEEILNALAPLPGLRVAARASSFSLRGKTDDLRAIGEKLQVTTVLEGSVRRAGDRVRITAQLSDAREGRQLWSERFDRELKDIFDVQEEIARAIVARLKITIAGGTRLVTETTTNIQAYELLLKGRVLVMRRGRSVAEAIPCFEQAIALDPNLSEAHALLGDAYRLLGLYGVLPAKVAVSRARAAIDRALAIDPNQPEAVAAIANNAAIFEWDHDEFIRRYDRALALDPSSVRAITELAIASTVYQIEPSPELDQKVLSLIARAKAIDPLNAWVVAIETAVLIMIGRVADAVPVGRRAIQLDENNFTAHWFYTSALAAAGREDEAMDAATRALAMSGRHPSILTIVSAIHAARGAVNEAEAIRLELSQRAEAGYIGEAARAAAAAAAGKWEEARTMLRRAIDERDPYLTFWKLYAWRPVWQDAECAAIIRATPLFSETRRLSSH